MLVGGALTAGFRLTNRLLGSTPKESVERQARAAQAKAKDGVIDIEAKVLTLPQSPDGQPTCHITAHHPCLLHCKSQVIHLKTSHTVQ